MERARDAAREGSQPQKPRRVNGLQEETEHPGPSFQSISVIGNGAGDQLNAPGSTVNKSTGNGNHFTGAKFSGPVYFGKNGRFR